MAQAVVRSCKRKTPQTHHSRPGAHLDMPCSSFVRQVMSQWLEYNTQISTFALSFVNFVVKGVGQSRAGSSLGALAGRHAVQCGEEATCVGGHGGGLCSSTGRSRSARAKVTARVEPQLNWTSQTEAAPRGTQQGQPAKLENISSRSHEAAEHVWSFLWDVNQSRVGI